jgi:hypothetical protein
MVACNRCGRSELKRMPLGLYFAHAWRHHKQASQASTPDIHRREIDRSWGRAVC